MKLAIAMMLTLWSASNLIGKAPASAHDETAAPSEVTFEQRLDAQIPLDLVFNDESGRAVPLKSYFDGQPVLLALVYYDCPRLCPLVLEGLNRSLRPLSFRAGEHYRVVAVSIDPNETPDLARQKKTALWSKRTPEADGWHLLTGTHSAIDRLAEAVGFNYAINPDAADKDRFVHASGIMVVTPQGRISRYFYGFDYPPRDLRLAMIEASDHRIGSPIDQLLLLCYQYDPSQAKYTLSILKLLRISGSATALALGAFLVFMFVRERRGQTGRAHTRENTD